MDDPVRLNDAGAASPEKTERVDVFNLAGPAWRPRLHPGSKTIGVPDLYASRTNQTEDELSESSIRSGYSIPQCVGNETFSAHDMIFDRLKAKTLLKELGELFHEVTLRKVDISNHRTCPGPLNFRPPQRVTLNEVKLAAYVKELANPDVPLRKLARSVPHGYRGERMLEMLWNGGNLSFAMAAMKAQANQDVELPRPVTIERAIWFVRVVGSSEVTSSRARQSNANSYTVEWTNVLMGWLRKQILELNAPRFITATPIVSSPPAVSNGRSATHVTAKSASLSSSLSHDGATLLILEEDFHQRWVTKWQYSVELLRGLTQRLLTDPQVAMKSILDMIRTANIAQISFLLALFEEYVEIVFINATIMHYALNTFCTKLAEAALTTEQGHFGEGLRREMEMIVKQIASRAPTSLINPSRWTRHSDLLTRLMSSCLPTDKVLHITRRNSKLLSALLTSTPDVVSLSAADERRIDIAILDGIGIQTGVKDAFFQIFRAGRQSSSDKLRTVLLWSTTVWRSGSYRAYAGAQLLSLFSQHSTTRPNRKEKSQTSFHRMDLDTFLLKWISEVESAMHVKADSRPVGSNQSAAIESVDVASLICLVGEAIRLGSFSYVKYLQRLTARGLTATSSRENKDSHQAEYLHAKIMRSVPLSSVSASLEHQRRVAIYGNRNRESWEDAMQRRAWKEVGSAFPCSPTASLSPFVENSNLWKQDEPLRHFWSSSRFVQYRVIQDQIMTHFRQAKSFKHLTASGFVQVSDFLARAGDFNSLCELILIMLDSKDQSNSSLLSACRDVAQGYRMLWISMRLPLLERLLIEPFPLHDSQLMANTARQHGDTEVARQLQESATLFLLGDHTQATQVLAQIVRADQDGDFLACSVLLAAVATVAAATSSSLENRVREDQMVRLVTWMKLVPASAKVEWNSGWQSAIVCFMQSQEMESQGKEKALSLVILHLVRAGLLSATSVLRCFVIPCLEQSCTARDRGVTPSMLAAIDLLRGMLLADSEPVDPSIVASLRSLRSSFLSPGTMKDVVVIISCLAILEGRFSSTELPRIRQAICLDETVQIYFHYGLPALSKILQDKVRGSMLNDIIVDLTCPQSSNSILCSPPLEVNYQKFIEGVNEWQYREKILELSLFIQRLEHVESGLQNRSQAKVENIARLSVGHRWFSRLLFPSHGLSLLSESRSTIFAATVAEELLKKIYDELRGDDKGATSRMQMVDSISDTLQLIQASPTRCPLATSSVTTSILALICESLDASRSRREEQTVIEKEGEEEEKDDDEEEEGEGVEEEKEEEEGEVEEWLGVQLSILCCLLRFDNLWTPSTRALAPSLFFTLLRLGVTLSGVDQTRDAAVVRILDVASYFVQELPQDVQQVIQNDTNAIDSMILLIQEVMAEDDVTSRVLLLLNRCIDNSTATTTSLTSSSSSYLHAAGARASSLIMASDSKTAFVDGAYLPVADKPWEWHNTIEAEDGTRKDELGLNFLPFTNSGPISLELFQAKRTSDRLPESDVVSVDSEVSYGLGWGGETIYARDIRRGLLDLEMDEDVKRQGKSLARFKSSGDGQLASGLESSLSDAASTPVSNSSMSTAKKRRDAPTSTPSKEEPIAKKRTRKR
ncbi:hypothetical protein CBS101457_004299 [Exobasidium rhododendri]|nr:hypothetical protein CBS101457_004299 [Exobasidium rhododendri]